MFMIQTQIHIYLKELINNNYIKFPLQIIPKNCS